MINKHAELVKLPSGEGCETMVITPVTRGLRSSTEEMPGCPSRARMCACTRSRESMIKIGLDQAFRGVRDHGLALAGQPKQGNA